jgi:hypothetical protein
VQVVRPDEAGLHTLDLDLAGRLVSMLNREASAKSSATTRGCTR